MWQMLKKCKDTSRPAVSGIERYRFQYSIPPSQNLVSAVSILGTWYHPALKYSTGVACPLPFRVYAPLVVRTCCRQIYTIASEIWLKVQWTIFIITVKITHTKLQRREVNTGWIHCRCCVVTRVSTWLLAIYMVIILYYVLLVQVKWFVAVWVVGDVGKYNEVWVVGVRCVGGVLFGDQWWLTVGVVIIIFNRVHWNILIWSVHYLL